MDISITAKVGCGELVSQAMGSYNALKSPNLRIERLLNVSYLASSMDLDW